MAKILVLTSRFPYPPMGGDKLRIYKICQKLSEDNDVTLLSICSSKEELNYKVKDQVFDKISRVYLPKWKSYSNSFKALLTQQSLQVAYYYSRDFNNLVKNEVKDNDIVLAHLLRTGQYIESVDSIPKILEMTDAISLNYQRISEIQGQNMHQKIFSIEKPRALKNEIQAVDSYDLVSLVSEIDKNYLINKGIIDNTKRNKIKVYSNGVDLNFFPFKGPAKSNKVAFLGNMNAAHNLDACKFFVNEILPDLRAEKPGIQFKIIGIGEEDRLAYFNKFENVFTTGKVNNVAQELSTCFCGFGALRHGAGLQNKILEYMAVGLPVVTNSIGAEGTTARNNRDFIIANTTKELKQAIIDIYENDSLRQTLSMNGRKYVLNNHQWDKILDGYKKNVQNLIANNILSA